MSYGDTTHVGIFGGAFNPPTIGHIHVLESVLNWNLVGNVWLMPADRHMHGKNMLPFEERAAMCEISIKGIPQARVIMHEHAYAHKTDGSTFAIIDVLQKMYPTIKFSIIIGQDNADSIETWKNWEHLIEKNRFIVLPRQGETKESAMRTGKGKWYNKNAHIFLVDAPLLPISSTMVREHLATGKNTEHLLQAEVAEYIRNKGFYV